MSAAIYDALLDCDHARYIGGDAAAAMQVLTAAVAADNITAGRLLASMPGCPAMAQRLRQYLLQAMTP